MNDDDELLKEQEEEILNNNNDNQIGATVATDFNSSYEVVGNSADDSTESNEEDNEEGDDRIDYVDEHSAGSEEEEEDDEPAEDLDWLQSESSDDEVSETLSEKAHKHIVENNITNNGVISTFKSKKEREEAKARRALKKKIEDFKVTYLEKSSLLNRMEKKLSAAQERVNSSRQVYFEYQSLYDVPYDENKLSRNQYMENSSKLQHVRYFIICDTITNY
jgi:hypothetical protein